MNCHELFLDYNNNLEVTSSKKESLKKARKALRNKIRNYFKLNHPEYIPKFKTQGSHEIGVMIRTKDDECDLDDGVYFLKKPNVSSTTLQSWIYRAVEGHTSGGQQHRKKCIRVVYMNDYHIDLPAYCKEEGDLHPFLAVKDEGFSQSDPKDFIDWFNKRKTSQLVRIIRYLKGWADHVRHNMPSGLAFTILAERNNYGDERDDLALYKVLQNIRADLKYTWECIIPATPYDDVIAKHDKAFQARFFDALDNFIDDAKKAIDEICEKRAAALWAKHLGARFPEGSECDEAEEIGEAEKQGALLIKPTFASGIGLVGKSKGGSFGGSSVLKSAFLFNPERQKSAMIALENAGYISKLHMRQYHIKRKATVWTFKMNKVVFEFDEKQLEIDFSKYGIEITYYQDSAPIVKILSPKVSLGKHLYPDGSLCLYKPSNFQWKDKMSIKDDLFPSICTWLYFHEKWVETGTWFGEEAEH